MEIPFHKPAPAGFHSTVSEDRQAETIRNQRLKDVDYRRLTEKQYRSRDRERKEKQRREEARLRSLERSNMQYVVAEVSKRNDPLAIRKRGVLQMPAPSVGDEELRRVAKAGEEERSALAGLAEAGGRGDSMKEGRGVGGARGATDALLGDYADRPLPTPMRTPLAPDRPSATEIYKREALNLRGQTPLLGQENAEMRDEEAGTAAELRMGAFSSTPMMGGLNDDATSSRTAGGPSAQANATPLTFGSYRDELRLNATAPHIRPPSELRPVTDHDGEASIAHASVGASSFGASTFASDKSLSLRELAKEERRRTKRARRELEEALASLPAPQFEYELAVPEDAAMEEVGEEETRVANSVVQDQADQDAAELEQQRKEAERLYEEQSSVVKRVELPRIMGGALVLRRLLLGAAPDLSDQCEKLLPDATTRLIYEETAQLINYDARSHPVLANNSDPIVAGSSRKDKKDKKKRKHQSVAEHIPDVTLDYFSEEALRESKAMLEEEFRCVVQEKRELLTLRGSHCIDDRDVLSAAVEKTTDARSKSNAGMAFSMEKGSGGWDGTAITSNAAVTQQDEIATLRSEHKALQLALKSLNKTTTKLEHKLDISTGGYHARSTALIGSVLHSFAELQHSRIEEAVYINLKGHEFRGAALREEKLREEVERLEEEEAEKQRRYGELLHEKNRLRLRMSGVAGQGKIE